MILAIFITFFLVFLNGFFVAAEFAIVKVRASQLELRAQSGSNVAALAKNIVSHLDGYLAATQLGITLASLGLGWIGEPVVSKIIMNIMEFFELPIKESVAHHIALPIAFITITVLHIVFGELAPKSFAIQRSETTTMVVSYPLQFFYVIFKPFIWVLNGFANAILRSVGLHTVTESEVHSSDELKYLVEKGKEHGKIEETNYHIIKNAFDFSDRSVRQIMIPRVQVVAIDVNDFQPPMLEKVLNEGYSRIPCYEDSWDKIVGVIYVKDILMCLYKKEPIDVRKLARSALMVPESKKLGLLLKEFQESHQQIAIVVNEYGGTSGIVSIEDILEELVGEIQDEYDDEDPFVEEVEPGIFLVRATSHFSDVNDLLPKQFEKNKPYQTLAGYLIDEFGRIPDVGEKICIGGYEITVLQKSRTSISLVKLQLLADPEESEDEDE